MDLVALKRELKTIVPSNRNPLYRSHLYWSQKPFNITDVLLEHLTNEGDVVFDPFLGSGVTLIESVLNGRKGIGVEINELPIFIATTLLTEVENCEELLQDFSAYLNTLRSYYETMSTSSDEVAVIEKVIFDMETPFATPQIKEILYKIPGQNAILSKEPDMFDIEKMLSKNKLLNIKDFIMVENRRLAVHENQPVSTLFTPRTLNILDNILGYINNIENMAQKNALRYILMSTIHLVKITDLKSNSQWPLWMPKKDCVEKNVINIFKRRLKLFNDSLNFVRLNTENPVKKAETFQELIENEEDFLILNKGIQYVTNEDIPDDSVDLVITDPPYMGQVLYSEYMQLYYPFLGLNYNFEDEIVVSNAEGRQKGEDQFFDLLEEGFEKIAAKLKSGKMLCLYFHDINLNVWDKLISITKRNHLYFVTQMHIHKKMTLKNILSPKKSLQGDSILFFIKEVNVYRIENARESLDEILENINAHLRYEVKSNGPLSTADIIDNGLMELIIQNDWMSSLSKSYKTIVDLIELYLEWDSKTAKWYIEN